jgi:hypothetical protein
MRTAFSVDELIIDNFAGGGGASLGIEMALSRPVDIAINHDAVAVAMHAVNHPGTKHYCENVWDVDPAEACGGRPVGGVWFSPDCKHFSKAKGGKPVEKKIRGLAWVVLRWAAKVRPRIIWLENVEEFITWGPLVKDENGDHYPCPKRKGRTFNAFVNALKRHGYEVEWRELRACDFGAPTIRKRLFLRSEPAGAAAYGYNAGPLWPCDCPGRRVPDRGYRYAHAGPQGAFPCSGVSGLLHYRSGHRRQADHQDRAGRQVREFGVSGRGSCAGYGECPDRYIRDIRKDSGISRRRRDRCITQADPRGASGRIHVA